jgi:hypothetical protein
MQQAQGELEIQSILCLKCDMGAFWMDGHDDECPKSNEKITTTTTKKTGASCPKTKRKSQENRKWQVNGKRVSGNNEQKFFHATMTPSAVFTLTTITTMSSMGVTTRTNAGICRRPPTQNVDHDAVSSTAAAPRLVSLCPLFCSAPPLWRVPLNCCFNWQPFYCRKKQERMNHKHHGGPRGRPPNCNFNCPRQR